MRLRQGTEAHQLLNELFLHFLLLTLMNRSCLIIFVEFAIVVFWVDQALESTFLLILPLAASVIWTIVFRFILALWKILMVLIQAFCAEVLPPHRIAQILGIRVDHLLLT